MKFETTEKSDFSPMKEEQKPAKIESLEISEIYDEVSLVRKRKSKLTRHNISFESEVHNIYSPEYSSSSNSE